MKRILSSFLILIAGCATSTSLPKKVTFNELNCNSATSERLEKLKSIVRASLNEGLSCINSFDRKEDVKNLLAITSTSITLSCVQKESGVIARAIPFGNKNFPGIELNPEIYLEQESEGGIFHEALHWLGYKHFAGVDIPYLAEVCCFSKKNGLQKLACELLSNKKISWTDEEYIKKFTQVLREGYLSKIGLRTAWNATKELKNNNSDLIYVSAREIGSKKLNGKFSNEFISIIFMHASLPQLSPKLKIEAPLILSEKIKDYFPSNKDPKIDFALLFGDAIAGILQSNNYKFDEAWLKLELLRPHVCKLLSDDEKEQLLAATQMIAVSLFEIRPRVNSEALVKWNTLCGS